MRILCTGLLFFALSFSFAARAQNILLKMTDENDQLIATEGTLAAFKDHLEALSYAQASTAACSTTSSGLPGCQSTTGNLFFTVRLDKSLSSLRRIMYKGLSLKKITVFFTETAGFDKLVTYYSVHMEMVNVASINDAKSDGEKNTIQLEFAPQKIGWAQYAKEKDGTYGMPVKFGWDRGKNQEWTSF